MTLSELFHFREFRKHTNNCLTFITRFDWETHIFGKFDTPEVREHCRNERVNFDSMRYFIPFVTVTCFNDKGRFHFAVINESPVREPHRNEWITTTVSERDVNDLIRHNGSYATTNVFFRAQSGHSTLREEQRETLGPPYDFRHNALMHKTSARNWDNMKKPDGSRQVVPFDRDIHFVPVEFLYHDPEMLRQYGERILLFNMNDPATKEAFSTARESDNGYILVSPKNLLALTFWKEFLTWN